MNHSTCERLLKARRYHESLQEYEAGRASTGPQFNPIFHGFRSLLAHEYPVRVHTQIDQLLMTTLDTLEILDMLEVGENRIYFLLWREPAAMMRPYHELHRLSSRVIRVT